MAAKRIYIINATGKPAVSAWLVDAMTKAQAINHVVRGEYSAVVATSRQVADLIRAGYVLEEAGEDSMFAEVERK